MVRSTGDGFFGRTTRGPLPKSFAVRGVSFDDATSHQHVTLVKYRRLPWGQSPLGFVKADHRPVVLRVQNGWGFGCLVSNLYRHPSGTLRRRTRRVVDTGRPNPVPIKGFFRPNHNPIGLSVHLHHVERLSGIDPQAPALAYGEILDSLVFTQDGPIHVHDVSRNRCDVLLQVSL